MIRLLLLAGSVAFTNIMLNLFASKATAEVDSWLDVFKTSTFGITFVTGVASLVLMTTLYYVGRSNSFGMANGVLLMGAMSIIGGTFVGLLRGNSIHWSEWALMAMILCFVGVRYGLVVGVSK